MSFQNARVLGVNVDSTVYHQQSFARGEPGFYMSPSSLKELKRCPQRWKDGYEPPESKAKDDGNLFDCLLLTPDQFQKRYAVKPATYCDEKTGEMKPWNGNSNKCKAWLADHEDFEPISAAEHEEVSLAITRFLSDEVLRKFHADSDKQVLTTAEWHDPETGIIVPVRCLMDLVPKVDSEFGKSLGDIKRTRNAGLHAFRRDCHKFGHHIQAAFDMDIYVAATGEDRCNWVLLVAENYPPYQTAKRLLAQDFLDIGRAEYKAALSLYCKCIQKNFWPDYDDNDEAVQSFSIVAPEPWMASEGQFAPRVEFPGDAPEEEPDEFVSQEPT